MGLDRRGATRMEESAIAMVKDLKERLKAGA